MKYLSFLASLPLLKFHTAYADGIMGGIYANCQTTNGSQNLGPDKAEIECVVLSVINMAGQLVGAILVVMIVISGIMYITSMGNPDKVGLAKKTLVGAIIGLIIVVLSNFMVNLLWTLFK